MSQLCRVAVLSKIMEADAEMSPSKSTIVSPISDIARDLRKSSLNADDTPKRITWKHLERDNKQSDSRKSGNNTGLFKHAFKIKSTPEGSVKSKPKARRLLGMASRRLSSPETVSPSINKENDSVTCNPSSCSPQKLGIKKSRYPLEDCDPNSQDSGYGTSHNGKEDKSQDGFQFAEPLGVAPRRMSVESRGSPMQSPIRSSPQRLRTSRHCLFRSLSSGYESMDDGFNDLVDVDTLDDATQLPNGISSLLSGHIMGTENAMESEASTTPESSRTKASDGFALRRSLSSQYDRYEKNPTPTLSKVRSCLFRSPNATSSTAKLNFDRDFDRRRATPECSPPIRSFKRPEPPTEASPKLVKRSRVSSNVSSDVERGMKTPEIERSVRVEESPKIVDSPLSTIKFQKLSKPLLPRSLSESQAHANIEYAIHRSTTDADLTGDFSKPCILPLAVGHHEDLKSISASTLAALIRGDFSDRISTFKIVDCRYPYEFEGGHIKGALNLYNRELIEQQLLVPLTHVPEIQPDSNKRSILVFHCEFSWERGPNLSRFLRNIDRQRNKEHYPALHYPEVYLLHGGYEQFYKEQKDFCIPQGYRPMKHPDHEEDLRQFRSKSKSWQGERSRITGLARTNLKRLGF